MSILEAYLGLDVSPTKVGWGAVRATDGAALRCGSIAQEDKPKGTIRTLAHLERTITGTLGVDVEFSAIYVEAPAGGSFGYGPDGAIAVGMVLQEIEHRWPWAFVDLREPSEWRSPLGLPTRPRPKAKAAALRLAGELGFAAADDDAAEGACLARAVWVDLERGRDGMFRKDAA